MLEHELGRLADQQLGTLGIADPGELDQQAVVAHALDDRLAQSGGVHPLLDGSLQRLHLVLLGHDGLARLGVHGTVDQVASALEIQSKAQPEERVPAALEVADLDLLEAEDYPGQQKEDGDQYQRPGVPTHRCLQSRGSASPSPAPPPSCLSRLRRGPPGPTPGAGRCWPRAPARRPALYRAP